MIIRGRLAIVLLTVLVLSLAVNFVVAGFVIARSLGLGRLGPVEQIVAIGARAFPGEIRRAIVAEALGDGAALRDDLAELRAARQRAFDAMRAEPFDRAALDAAFAEVRARTDRLQTTGQGIVADAVAAAPAEVRREIVAPGE
jgi:hypothetical protein